MATMEKIFKCLSCSSDIRLERKPDNTGWLKYNLDGTEHKDEKQQQYKSNNNNNGAQIEALTKKVETLESKVDTLIAQIQMLRSELKTKK